MKLILFDIDGTLLDSLGAGSMSLEEAFRELYSIDCAFEGIRMAGKTDIRIFREGLQRHGIPSDNGAMEQIRERYLSRLRERMSLNGGRVMPGVVELLNELKRRDDCAVGLLTGNLEEGARIKLGHFGLWGYFSHGAFGSDDPDRNKLLPIAVKRFEDGTGRSYPYKDCVIIGDTPLDVECTKPYGAVSIGVATGLYSMEDLRACGADIVFETLSPVDKVLEFIMS